LKDSQDPLLQVETQPFPRFCRAELGFFCVDPDFTATTNTIFFLSKMEISLQKMGHDPENFIRN
jgi:hypothetical protein